MKKITGVLLAGLFLASCNKDYNCLCNYTDTQSNEIAPGTANMKASVTSVIRKKKEKDALTECQKLNVSSVFETQPDGSTIVYTKTCRIL